MSVITQPESRPWDERRPRPRGATQKVGPPCTTNAGARLYVGSRCRATFRLGGFALLALLVVVALRRRNQCSIGGVRRIWRRLALALGVAVATYLVLYAGTTWLGTFA